MLDYKEECTNPKCKKIIPASEAEWIGYPFCKDCSDKMMKEFKKEFGEEPNE